MKKTIVLTFTLLVVGFAFMAVTTDSVYALGSSEDGGCCDSGGGGGSTPSNPSTPGGGSGGSGGGSTPVTPPVCTLTINKTQVQAGETYTMSWNVVSSAAVNVYINDYKVAKSGSATYTFSNSNLKEDFTLRANNAGGDCMKFVEVKKIVPIVTAPVCDVTASVSTVSVGGQYTISWNGTPSSAVFKINGTTVSANDSATYTFVGPNTETFTFTGANGGGTCTDTVVVSKTPVVTPTAPVCVLTATPNAIQSGSSARLTWTASNTSGNAGINQGVGGVVPTNTTDFRTVSPTVTTTYTMTVSNSAGVSATCAATITVTTTPPPPAAPVCDSFTASASSVRSGSSVTLSWNTTNASEVTIDNGVGAVSVDGSRDVVINNNINFILTAKNAQGQQVTCSRPIDIESSGGGGGGSSSSNPRCELKASKTKINGREEITLTWETSRANEITIFEGTVKNGKKIFDSDDDDVVDEGSIKVRPTKDTTYTILAERGSRDRDCSVKVTVDNKVIVTSTNDQGPRVAGIALTQVPYTGFEAGTALTIFFYFLLALWGLFVAYSLTIKKNSILGFSLAGAFPRNKVITDLSTETMMNTEEVSKAEVYVATATAPANLPTGNAPIIGYASFATAIDDMTETEEKIEINEQFTDLENRAHSKHILLSSDAMRFFAALYSTEEQFEALDSLIAEAKAAYPTEDGWVVLNLERMQALVDATPAASAAVAGTTPAGAGSLAEAIVTGNIVAAYAMIGHRPMIALADAAADLDAVYRLRQGGDATVSDMLVATTSALTELQLSTAISALSGALDGIYTSEAEAVKMAIMKAVKSIHN